ncbi:MAG: hypothetical protein QOE76_3727 [Frankiales bacterium]|jgi:hypothetical protein|nr:hypothetical protein [Frankiales bacterium]
MPTSDGLRASSSPPPPRAGRRRDRDWWLAGGYLFVGLFWWFNFVWTGGGWRLSLAILWTVLGVGMAFAARSSRSGHAEKLRQHPRGDRPEATKVDDEKRQARLYEWVAAFAILGGSESFSRKVLDAKSRMQSSRKCVDRPEQPGPRDVSENEAGPPRGE